MACRILVPTLGMEPAPPAVEVRSSNHWTAREVLMGNLSNSELFIKRAAFSFHWTSLQVSRLQRFQSEGADPHPHVRGSCISRWDVGASG